MRWVKTADFMCLQPLTAGIKPAVFLSDEFYFLDLSGIFLYLFCTKITYYGKL